MHSCSLNTFKFSSRHNRTHLAFHLLVSPSSGALAYRSAVCLCTASHGGGHSLTILSGGQKMQGTPGKTNSPKAARESKMGGGKNTYRAEYQPLTSRSNRVHPGSQKFRWSLAERGKAAGGAVGVRVCVCVPMYGHVRAHVCAYVCVLASINYHSVVYCFLKLS